MCNLYIFGIPGKIGGAATKIRHLIILLHKVYNITVILRNVSWKHDRVVTSFLKQYNINYCLLKELPDKLDGVGLAICEGDFFAQGYAREIKRRGLRVIWSNEMMWEFKGEADAVKEGLIDKVLFVSDFQAAKFADLYKGIPCAIPGNYVAPEDFEFRERRNPLFTIGRLSRHDPDKYPEDFPVFYEEIGLRDVRFRVMAWDQKLAIKYRWHRFGPEWELLAPEKEETDKFLNSLDLFVYPLGHKFKESWGRSTVEAMLMGCIPLVPAGHQFHNLIEHERSGFICTDFAQYRYYAHALYEDYSLRTQLSRQCADHARRKICDEEEHRAIWVAALTV